MSKLEKVILFIGLATFGFMLYELDAAAACRMVWQVGWGMALIIPQEAVAHLFNALGWRLAFPQEEAPSFPVWELFKLRVAGDGVNYLTPSASIAGEITRTTMLNDSHSQEVRTSSVVIARFCQTVAQFLCVLSGVVFIASPLLPIEPQWRTLIPYGGGFVFLLIGGFVAFALSSRKWIRAAPQGAREAHKGLKALPHHLRHYLREHPWRLALSVCSFSLAYIWGTFEAYWICRFLGVPVSVMKAMAIEVLAIGIDGVFFMVPAKVGTQEGSKTAIFLLLGMNPDAGLAFGVVRHLRELFWAGSGFLLYYGHRKSALAAAKTA